MSTRRKTVFILSFVMVSSIIYSQADTTIYTTGDIPTTYIASASITTSSSATDPGRLTVTIPTGNTTITSVDVTYQMTAINGAYMAEQRSFLKCMSTGGTTEPLVFSGIGNTEGTYTYYRTNLDIANNVIGGGNIVFKLHAFRTYFDDGSNTTHNYVNNNSWSVTVDYNYVEPISTPSDPTNFVITPMGYNKISLSWIENLENDSVMVAVNSVNSFGTPVNGTRYTVGSSISGGGTVLTVSAPELFNHINLDAYTTYYYKMWSWNWDYYYSSGVEGNATTRSNPLVSNVTFSITDGIVDVYYDITDEEETTFTIYMEASEDGGSTYNFACTQVTGDVGANVSIGTNKHIVWNFGREHSGVVGNNFRIKILADDLFGDQIYYAGKVYNTVTIGTQTWLKENLDVGTMIQSTTGGFQQTDNGIIEKYCYNNDKNNCATYGGMYEWNEAMQYVTTKGTQGICPSGWHIPTLSEWQTLITYVGNHATKLIDNYAKNGYTYTNETGFSAFFAGNRDSNGNFNSLGNTAPFWNSTEYNSNYADGITMSYNGGSVYYGVGFAKNYGFSVRCLKDSP